MSNRFKRRKGSQLPCRRKGNRDGNVLVETAFIIPMILVIMFATLEICAGYYVQESITIASYEGARFAAREYGRVRGEDEEAFQESDITDYVTQILTARRVTTNPTIVIDLDGKNFDNIEVLDPIRVTVSCPTDGNTTFAFGRLAGRTLTASVVFAAESQRRTD